MKLLIDEVLNCGCGWSGNVDDTDVRERWDVVKEWLPDVYEYFCPKCGQPVAEEEVETGEWYLMQ